MMMIPVHVIAFFLAVMLLPADVNQFTIDLRDARIQWTRQEAAWHAVEMPGGDWGRYSAQGTVVTISAKGRERSTDVSRFLSLPANPDWEKAGEVQVADKSLGGAVRIRREEGKITLTQDRGPLFEQPVTITWREPPAHPPISAVGIAVKPPGAATAASGQSGGKGPVYFTAQMFEQVDRDLRQIENAKALWAMDYNKTMKDEPTWADIERYLKGGIPKPPCGGNYVLNDSGTPPEFRISSKDLEAYKINVWKAEQ